MQHDARAGRADRVAERDGAAVDVELALVERAHGTVEPELFATVLLVLPRRQAAEHLRGEGLVDFPVIEIVEAEAMALEDRRRRMHRAESHLRRIEPGPLGIDDTTYRFQLALAQGLF